MISLLVGGLVALLVLSACVTLLGKKSARLSKEVARQARVIAMMKLGHDDPETNTAGWRFKSTSGHIHAIPPEGGDGYFAWSIDFDSTEATETERCSTWLQPSGSKLSDSANERITRAYQAWYRGRMVSGARVVKTKKKPTP